MKRYSNRISLLRNSRGVYCIDTVMGCRSGMTETEGGCYHDCYAAKAAKRYGIDFTTPVNRVFENHNHREQICNKIANAKMPFVRVGCSGDPSEDWNHSMSIIRTISQCNKELVIITRHWNTLSDLMLGELGRMNVCVNTSVSALDSQPRREHSIRQHERLRRHCKSVLRVVSCKFDESTPEGMGSKEIQDSLLESHGAIGTVFRPSKLNPFVVSGLVVASDELFNGKKQLASKHNARVYMGKCSTCCEMCGVNSMTGISYSGRPGVLIQRTLFDKPKHSELIAV